jgi:hypothetical protein
MELMNLPKEDFADLCKAKRLLEHPSFTARISNLIGKPIEKFFQILPKGWDQLINEATTAALSKALEVAINTFGKEDSFRSHPSNDNWHKMAVIITGGVGGAFGLASTLVELPITTTLILRSIADIARSEGHDIRRFEIQLSCIEVFALGGKRADDDASETGYWSIRAGLASQVAESSPQIFRLISKIASRFSVQVTEEAAAKAVPVVGILSGSLINMAFINHFQSVAKGHFIIKRLENQYGSETIKQLYNECQI